jgi:protein-disulfide isomerase
MNKSFFGIIVVVVAALIGVFALTSNNKNDSGSGSNSAAQPSSHITGKTDSKVALVEYGDFQCPACKSFFPIVNELKATYGDRVAFQFSHFPLTQIHPNAFIGSRAAEAAGKQGKFFEMHDLLYENQDSWSQSPNPNQILEGYASQLGLKVDQFKSDMASAGVADIINADQKAGQQLGANSTPTFVLNNKKIEKNPTSMEEFKKLLDEELAKNQ